MDFCVQQRTHENWDVRRYSPERERVIVLSSIFYYSVNTVIWCSEQENSSDCLSYKMDIWQSMCVTPAIYGIPETVITLIFQTIKTGSRKSTIWFEKQLEYGHINAHQNQLHGTVKTLPLNICRVSECSVAEQQGCQLFHVCNIGIHASCDYIS